MLISSGQSFALPAALQINQSGRGTEHPLDGVNQPLVAAIAVDSGKQRTEGELAVLGEGSWVHFEAGVRAQALLLTGVPLREPVVQYGYFVMNTERGIMQAIEDYRVGRLGEILR